MCLIKDIGRKSAVTAQRFYLALYYIRGGSSTFQGQPQS